MMTQKDIVTIFMIDDDEIDIEMFRRSMVKRRVANPLVSAFDGEDALEKLNSGEIQKPLMIILDINMPRMGGVEFLAELRKNETYKDTVVFVMTTSDADSDKVEAYNFNIAGYMVKSEIGDSFMNAIELFDQYWKTIHLPV